MRNSREVYFFILLQKIPKRYWMAVNLKSWETQSWFINYY